MKEKTEELKKEVRELLAGDKMSTSEIKKVFYDEQAKQFVIKIPSKLALGGNLKKNSEVKIVVNPQEEDFDEAINSKILIYGKEESSSQN